MEGEFLIEKVELRLLMDGNNGLFVTFCKNQEADNTPEIEDNSDYYQDSVGTEASNDYKTIMYYKNKTTGEIKEFNQTNFPWKDTVNWEFVKTETVKK